GRDQRGRPALQGGEAGGGQVAMRKEQILLLVCAGIAALLFMSARGRYDSVNAAALAEGATVDKVRAERPNVDGDLKADPLKEKWRALAAKYRPEKRPDLPELPAPALPPIVWVHPPTTPGL